MPVAFGYLIVPLGDPQATGHAMQQSSCQTSQRHVQFNPRLIKKKTYDD
jgi:hypothetical protein